MKTVYNRPALTAKQLQFLKIHILSERKKARESMLSEEAQSEDVTMPKTIIKTESDSEPMETARNLSGEEKGQSLSPGTPTTSSRSSSPEQSDSLKTSEKSKENEPDTTEDIAKHISALQAHLEEMKAEKHRLFQKLKQVLHEEDEKKKMHELKQKQEMEKSMGMEFAQPMDPRLVQGSGGQPLQHPLPTSPTNIGVPGRGSGSIGPPTIKKQSQRVPLLPTPEGGPVMFRRQSSSGPFRHSSTDSFHSPSHPPYNAHHHVPGGGNPPLARGGPYQDQRGGGAHSIGPQDIHMHGGSRPGTGPPGLSGMQQPQFQGGNYQFSGAPYSNVRGATPSQPSLMQVGPPQFQQGQPPPQQVAPPPQGFRPSHDLHMGHLMQPPPAQFQSQPGANLPPHFGSQGGPGGSGSQVPGGQMVGGIQQQQHYPNSNPLHKPEQQLNLGPQTYSVHSKGMQDPRQQKLLMDQQQPRVAHNSPYIKQESHHQGSPSARDRKME